MWLRDILKYWSRQVLAPGSQLRRKYQYFRDLLAQDRHCLEKMAEIEEIHYRGLPCDYAKVVRLCQELVLDVELLIKSLIALNPLRYRILKDYNDKVAFYVQLALSLKPCPPDPPYVLDLASDHCSPELVGGKATHLALIKKHGFPVPDGFCITTRAFDFFVQTNQLRSSINRILSHICLHSDQLEKRSAELQELIYQAEVPEELSREVEGTMHRFAAQSLAFRSSACGEDSELSFAGQYTSRLNVRPQDWIQAYKEVLASKYSVPAISYRIRAGLPDEMLSMAVLVLDMIPALESGVVYTSDVTNPEYTGIYMVPGLGDKLMGGECRAREFLVPKGPKPASASNERPYLPRLLSYAWELEEFFGGIPQDIEWVVDEGHEIHLVQSRPLQGVCVPAHSCQLDLPVLARGQWASPGRAGGTLFKIQSRADIFHIPFGAVVFTPGLYPELAAEVHTISGIIAAHGSAASHLATVAREAKVPVIILPDQDIQNWEDGQQIVVDADLGLIHAGTSKDIHFELPRPETWMTAKMPRILESISSLNLKDAQSQEFIPENCRSLHDLIRFAHEMGVREMFSLADPRGKGLGDSKILDLDLPLTFRVLNLEEGLDSKAGKLQTIRPEHITSKPFQALFQGLAQEGITWDHSTWHFDWQEFDKMSAGIFDPTKSPTLSSYALVARDYMHALLRFGYHFAVVDALISERKDQNYVQFSFKGGGGGEEQKVLRLEIIRRVLGNFHFQVQIKGELLTAELAREDLEVSRQALVILGYVLGRTRLMDLGIESEQVPVRINEIIEEIHAALAI
ncbi:MAG: PEP/pyruvate-binding domain-containing protein [Thermodesulfobacteriota bacterium]